MNAVAEISATEVEARSDDSLSAGVAGAARIAALLRREIVARHYRNGDRLPAERALATHFGVARGTVRAALRHLEELQLVTRRGGSGTFVRHAPSADEDEVAETTSPLELIEVRVAVEPHIVRLAVMHASARDLAGLGAALARLDSCDDDPERFSDADEQFHLRLAECARNPLLLWLYRHINEVRGHAQWSARKDKILTPQRIREYNTQHRALFDALQSRDMEAAVLTIRAHLEKARADLLGFPADHVAGQVTVVEPTA